MGMVNKKLIWKVIYVIELHLYLHNRLQIEDRKTTLLDIYQ